MGWRLAILGSLAFVVSCGTLLAIDPGDGSGAADAGSESNPNPTDAPTSAEASSDARAEGAAGGDAGPCNLSAPFDTPVKIVTSTAAHVSATLTEDERTIFLDTLMLAGPRQAIFVSNRADLASSFPAGTEITGPVASGNDTYNAALSTNGLGLVFISNRGAATEYRLYLATRSNTMTDFAVPMFQLATIGPNVSHDLLPFVAADGELWFASDRRNTGSYDIYRAPYQPAGSYGAPVLAGGDLTTNANETKAVLTRDGLRIFFASDRAGGKGGLDIWTATRTSKSAEFTGAVVVSELNTTSADRPAWISADSCRLYFSSQPSGGNETIFVASRPPS